MSGIPAFIQNLSLDVTAGAVISSLFVCKCFEVNPSPEIMLGLGIAIWLIYTIDHLRDAAGSGKEVANPRHAFHLKYQKVMLIAAVIVFGLGVVNALWLPFDTIKAGMILGSLCGVYFVYLKVSSVHRFKELLAALIYTAGVFAGPVSLVTEWDLSYLILFFLFLLPVTANLFLFPLYEMEMDSRDQIASIALNEGRKKTLKLVGLLLVLHGVLTVWSMINMPLYTRQGYIFLLMNLALVMLLIWPQKFRKRQLYRWLGDGIFFIPLFGLL